MTKPSEIVRVLEGVRKTRTLLGLGLFFEWELRDLTGEPGFVLQSANKHARQWFYRYGGD